jgi:SSS family solute:Na+ symporter
VGALIGGVVMTIYFTAGGLLGTAWVNTLQLVVMLAGFLVALPFVVARAGGMEALTGTAVPPWFGDFTFSSGPGSGWTWLFLLAPAFLVSPGLIQKAYGGKSESAVRRGVAFNALALMAFAFVPVLFGMSARAVLPNLQPNDVLPTALTMLLPAWLGALALAAIFSTEVDTSDTILFMLSTSISQDLYKRFINPAASDRRLLFVARATAVAGGASGIALSIVLQSVISAVVNFYALLVVTLFVPIVGGLVTRRGGPVSALSAIAAGVTTMLVLAFALPRSPWVDPPTAGVLVAAAAFALTLPLGRKSSAG